MYVPSQQIHYCNHPIFCREEILKAVSKHKELFKDDFKQFVDLVLKVDVDQALKSFNEDSIEDFISKNFQSSDKILKPVTLPDYVQKPKHFEIIKDENLREFAYDLNKRWNQLARKVDLNFESSKDSKIGDKQGKCLQNCSTFLPILNNRTFVIPGGRFRQGYYWDSYWIIKGLIASKMLDTSQTMVRNFLEILKEYGFIPNGFRQYYLNRSQPPFMALMIKDVTEALYLSGQKERAAKLEQDALFQLFGQSNQWNYFRWRHVVIRESGKSFGINYYSANTSSPRPESYRQDMELLQKITDQTKRKQIWQRISSMAESGWDFSSRWFQSNADILTTRINEVVPSDLNAILGLNEAYLAKLAEKLGFQDLQRYFLRFLEERKEYFTSIATIIKDPKTGKMVQIFPDYKPYKTSPKQSIYPSDFYPYLLFPNKSPINIQEIYNDVVNPVSSRLNTGQQWDSPNVWAPNNWMLHEVSPHAAAFRYAQEWVSTVYSSWRKSGLIYEKYRNDKLGQRGQGGQYQVQTGFGWTNGLALYYLNLYAKQLVAPDVTQSLES